MYADIIIFSIEKTITDKHRGKNAVEISDAKELPIEKTLDKNVQLTDVAAGGGTVFLGPGLRVLPEKGSAVFWYNLRRSGQVDPQTQHGACPVLFGSKWGTFFSSPNIFLFSLLLIHFLLELLFTEEYRL